MREQLLGTALGALFGGLGYFQLHQAIENRFYGLERKVDAIRGEPAVAKKHFELMDQETLEEYVKRVVARRWNRGLDELYHKLTNLPEAVAAMYTDARSLTSSPPLPTTISDESHKP
mmetsp:Transcript_1108/g.2319  ORF Transcript_1108/g.2319 Transcript_1108/m.2319 type:complete len:117 (-) Transcript_1108:473-823(-)